MGIIAGWLVVAFGASALGLPLGAVIGAIFGRLLGRMLDQQPKSSSM
jgi:uncharacterized membrane-anchored protein YhcB (DUF1043 family)